MTTLEEIESEVNSSNPNPSTERPIILEEFKLEEPLEIHVDTDGEETYHLQSTGEEISIEGVKEMLGEGEYILEVYHEGRNDTEYRCVNTGRI